MEQTTQSCLCQENQPAHQFLLLTAQPSAAFQYLHPHAKHQETGGPVALQTISQKIFLHQSCG